MTEGIIQKTFNQFRAERLGRSITHSETLTLERRLIEEIILLNVFQNNPMLMKLLIGDSK